MVQLPDITIHEARFAAFVEDYLRDPVPMLALKVSHTHEVLERARDIIISGEVWPCEISSMAQLHRACLIAAQYHDIGRFEQYVRWHTFSDAVSINHGALGSALLARRPFLKGEDVRIQRLVRVAVCLHNRLQLPAGLSLEERLTTEVVRDADKLDIFRIMAGYLDGGSGTDEVVLRVRDEPECWSPAVAATVCAGQTPSYRDLVYVNDFRILLVSWLRELRFACSRRRLASSGYLERILAGLPEDPALEPVTHTLREMIREALC